MKIERINPLEPEEKILEHAAKLINKGEVIVCPTDTGYAFSANALDIRAITKIFALKDRTFSNPIHVAVASFEEAEQYAFVNDAARYLAAHYLPGALTLVMKKKDTIPSLLVANLNTIGIRIPNNEVILKLAAKVGKPLTTTSANISGKPATYAVSEITAQFGENIQVPLALDQGALPGRDVSTIVDLSVSPPELIRQGRVSWLDIREVLSRLNNS
jgi:L-threonylcarbamoyladenylate synthase